MVVNTVNDYLNQTTLESLQAELPIEKGYCCDVLSTLRRMAVFCEGGAEACRRLLMQEPFQEARAEKHFIMCITNALKSSLCRKRHVV